MLSLIKLATIVVSLLFVVNQSSYLVAANLITETCSKTFHVDLCTSSLGVDPQSAKADVRGLAEIILGETLANAKEILANRVESFINQTTDPAAKECLAACNVLYGLVIDKTIPSAMWHLAVKKYEVAVGNAMDAAREIGACEEAFKERSLDSPLTSWNSAVISFAEISTSILFMLN